MKLFIVLLVVMVLVSSCCLAEARRTTIRRGLIGGIYGQEQNQHVQKGKSVEATESKVEQKKRKIDNHHNIPREHYSDWSIPPQGDNIPGGGDNSDNDGTG
ncbi:hypothetical protein ACFE04_002184 [Oxalis oulophora]